MDLRQLRYFVAIAESKSLTEAARRLNVVQPALSKRLADLEEELHAQLIVRGRLGTALTEAGAELHQRALLILKQVDAAADAVKGRSGVIHGPVAVGILRTLAPAVSARLFMLLRDELPGVVPDIRMGYSAELQQLLKQGRLDITMRLAHPGMEVGTPVFEERLCVVGHTSSLARFEQPQMGVKDLQQLELLLPSMQPVHSLLLDLAQREGLTLRVLGCIEDSSSLLDVCECTSAVTVLSEWAAGKALRQRQGLQAKVLSHPSLVRKVSLAIHEEMARTVRVMTVERLIVQVFEELRLEAAPIHRTAL